jgi:hypothetical protein
MGTRRLERGILLTSFSRHSQGTVVMGTQSLSVHEELSKKAKALAALTFRLANTVVGSGQAYRFGGRKLCD